MKTFCRNICVCQKFLVNELIIDEFFRGRSIPRNRELMRIFHDMDWVEQLGSGMRRILRKYPKEIYEISEHFVVVTFMFNDAVSQNVAVNVAERLTERQRIILNYIRTKVAENVAVNTQQIAVSLGVNRKTIQREMKTLIEYNLIYWDGAAKSGHWEIIQ